MRVLIIILFLSCTLFAQKVEVDQSFVDMANKAAVEAKASREAIGALQDSVAALKTQITAQQELIDLQKSAITIRDAQIADISKLKCSHGSFLFFVIRWSGCK